MSPDLRGVPLTCLARLLLCSGFVIMGALSPGPVAGLDLGLKTALPQPKHWQNNSTPSTMYCKFGYSLRVQNGTIQGVDSQHASEYTNFTFITLSTKKLAIRTVDGLYLCMYPNSTVYASAPYKDQDCEWKEQILRSFYNAYRHGNHCKKRRGECVKSYYLALNRNGSVRLGNMSATNFRGTWFLKRDSQPKTPPKGPLPPLPPKIETTSVSPSTTSTSSPHKRRKRPGDGCKRIKTPFCRRVRKRWREGKRPRRLKRRRMCRKLAQLQATLTNKKYRRLRTRCRRLRRKRLQRIEMGKGTLKKAQNERTRKSRRRS